MNTPAPILLAATLTMALQPVAVPSDIPSPQTNPSPAPEESGKVLFEGDTKKGDILVGADSAYTKGSKYEDSMESAKLTNSPPPIIGVIIPEGSDPTAQTIDTELANDRDDHPARLGCTVTDAEDLVAHLPSCDDPAPPEDASEPKDTEETDEPDSDPLVITVTASEFAELPLHAPEVNVQPNRNWVLVNMDTVVYADDAPQVLTTELLGVPVAVRATPVEFAWDFGDGSAPVVTASGGRPWPNQSVAHAYTHASQERIVTLTTTWSGEFQVAGQGPWVPIAGTVTTTSQSAPFAVETRHSHLVGAQGN